MTFGALWAFLAVALPVIASLLVPLSSVDLAWHLRAGGELLDSGRIATTDTYTFTVAGEPWFNQQWLAQAVLAAVYRVGGWAGLAILRAALVGVLIGLVFLACRRQAVGSRSAALLALAAFLVAIVTLALRPQLFGMVLFAATLLVVVERRRHPRLLWLVPVLAVAWANLHGSFFLAPAVLGLAWLHDLADRERRARRTLLVAVVTVLATCVTPFGPAVWTYAAGLTTNAAVTERITEWQPTSIRTPVGLAFFASALLLAAFIARRPKAVPWPALLWFGAFFVVGAWAVRGVAWWPMAAAVGLAGLVGSGFLGSGRAEPEPLLAADGARPAERPVAVNRAVAAVLVVAAVVLLPVWRGEDPGLGAPRGVVGQAPGGITAALATTVRSGDRLYHPQPWGSWFEFALPQATVAVDSRFELFPDAVWADYDAIAAGLPGWRERLDAWGVTVVVATNDRPGGLLEQLRTDAGWRSVHRDADGEVFVRADRE